MPHGSDTPEYDTIEVVAKYTAQQNLGQKKWSGLLNKHDSHCKIEPKGFSSFDYWFMDETVTFQYFFPAVSL